MFRFANFIGPTIDTALTRYLSLPVVPTAFGFDPRLQLIHEDDAIEILRRACAVDRPGRLQRGRRRRAPAVAGDPAGRTGARCPVPLPAIGLVAERGAPRRLARLHRRPDAAAELRPGRRRDARCATTSATSPRTRPSRPTPASWPNAARRRRRAERARRSARAHGARRRAAGAPWLSRRAAGLRAVADPQPVRLRAVDPVADDVADPVAVGRADGALAFLRRRLAGDYAVDDFGFDRELTEAVLLPALRPLYRAVVSHRGDRGRRTSPTPAARCWSATTPAACGRSTR